MAHILVVDDEEHLRNIFKQYLANDSHTVEVAADGHNALDLLKKEPFDLIITDIIMPEQDGLWLLTELRRHSINTKLIVMTGGSPRLDKGYLLKMAESYRVHKLLAKPVSYEQLKTTVDELLAAAP